MITRNYFSNSCKGFCHNKLNTSNITRSKSAFAHLNCNNIGSHVVLMKYILFITIKKKTRQSRVFSFNMVLEVLVNLLKNAILPL